MKNTIAFILTLFFVCSCTKNMPAKENAAVPSQTSEAAEKLQDEVAELPTALKNEENAVPEPEQSHDNEVQKPDMVLVDGGTFSFGWNEENRNVTLSSFEIGKTEITLGQYVAIMEDEIDPRWSNWPASGASWYDAVVFCNKASKAYGYTPCYSLTSST